MDKLSVVDQKSNNHSKSCTVDATSLYLKEIGRSPLLSADEEVFFATKLQQGDEAARHRMIESNLRLVKKLRVVTSIGVLISSILLKRVILDLCVQWKSLILTEGLGFLPMPLGG
jgi:hypothetical protein